MNRKNKIIIEKVFSKLGKKTPSNEEVCIYKSGLVDSFELLQVVLEIELMADISIDLEKLTSGDVSLRSIDKYVSSGIKQKH